MSQAAQAQRMSARLTDGVLAVHTVLFLTLYVTDAVLALRDWPWMQNQPVDVLLSQPVELFVIMLAPIALRVHLPDYRRHRLARTFDLWRDNASALLPFLLLAVWNAMTAALPDANLDYEDGKAVYILGYRFLMLFGGLTTAVLLVRLGWRWVMILILLVLLSSTFVDLAFPGTFSSAIGRAGGFEENPNLAAIAIVLMLALSVRYDRIHLLDLALILAAFTGVFTTLSRGGMIQLLVFILNYLWLTGQGRRVRQLLILPGAALTMALFAVLIVSSLTSSSQMFDAENAQRRLSTFTFENDAVYSSDEVRLDLMPKYLALIDEAVLVGHGAGYFRAMPLGPHNSYLAVWVDNGLVGLVLYVWLLLALLTLCWARRFWPGLVFVQVAIVSGFFSHNTLHTAAFVIPAGLVLGIGWIERQRGTVPETGDQEPEPGLAGGRREAAP